MKRNSINSLTNIQLTTESSSFNKHVIYLSNDVEIAIKIQSISITLSFDGLHE